MIEFIQQVFLDYLLPLIFWFLPALLLTPELYERFFPDPEICILDNYRSYTNIEQVLNLDDLKDKVVLINIWGANSSTSIEDSKYFNKLKKRYKNKPVELLHLAIPYGQPNDEQVWKGKFFDNRFYGINMLMSATMADGLWNSIENAGDNKYDIPRYLIADKKGNIVITNAERPGSKKEFIPAN